MVQKAGTIYLGNHRETHQPMVFRSEANECPTVLPPRNDLRNHSPSGFSWGYQG